MHWLGNPIDAGITTDGLVLRVDEDDFVVLVRRILVDPVGVQNTEVGAATSHALLGGRLERTLVFELVDTHIGGFACISM